MAGAWLSWRGTGAGVVADRTETMTQWLGTAVRMVLAERVLDRPGTEGHETGGDGGGDQQGGDPTERDQPASAARASGAGAAGAAGARAGRPGAQTGASALRVPSPALRRTRPGAI